MAFRIRGLDPAPFVAFYGRTDAELAAQGVQRRIADASPGYPDRVELRDAAPGEALLLMNWVHQPAAGPFRASHAIFVREGATRAFDAEDELPPTFLVRTLSLRAFDDAGGMVGATLVEGAAAADAIRRLLDDPRAAYLHAHYAAWGCYAARVDRA
jgi:hypothetical protein